MKASSPEAFLLKKALQCSFSYRFLKGLNQNTYYKMKVSRFGIKTSDRPDRK